MFDARQLHAWLGSKAQFGNWISERIEQYGFEPEFDFVSVRVKTGGRPRTDYKITSDMAKELAMVERTDRGRGTRRYLIEMEKAAHEMAGELALTGQPLRHVMIDGEPWFCGADILHILFGQASGKGDSYRKLESSEVGKVDRIALG